MRMRTLTVGTAIGRAMTIAVGTTSALLTATPAHAQEAPGTTTAPAANSAKDENSGQIQDIVVTAQRRNERLQDVPISASVMTSAALEAKNINSLVALAELNPAIQILPQGRSNRIYVRGIGSGETQSFDQSISTFVDDIYHGRSRLTSGTFLDVDRVEVLKGPQSTFFGNNAIAGAINIITKKPGKDFEADIRGLISPTSGENGGQYVAEAGVTAPLTDDFRIRIAATANGQAGYLRNDVTGKRAPKEDNLAGRITAVYEPSSVFDITVKGELTHNVAAPGLVGRRVNCPSPFAATVPGANGLLCSMALAKGLPIGLDTSHVGVLSGGTKILDTQDALIDANYHLGDVTLTSVTGFHAYQLKFWLDNGLTGDDELNVDAPEHYRQWSQELRLSSGTGGKVEWLAGLYGQWSDLRIGQGVNFFFLTPLLAGSPLAPFTPLGQRIDARVREDLYSAFGSLTYNATDKLKFNVGLRGSVVHKSFNWSLYYGTAMREYSDIVSVAALNTPGSNPLGLGTVGAVALSRTDHALMPSARIQYQVQPNIMMYASYSRGFKSGGFSIADVTAVASNYPFNPEHVNAYEVGLKSELFDRKVLLNLAAFRNDFSDLQVAIAINTGGSFQNFVRNAAAARSQGVELEAQWIISPMFRLSGEATYLDSKYLKYPGGEATLAQQLAGEQAQDLGGHHTLFAPKFSGNVTGTVTLPINENVQLITEGTAIFTTSYQTYASDDPFTLQPGYTQINARISLESKNGRWGIDLIGKNLNNRIIRTVSAYEPLALGPLIQDRKQLRNIALQVRLKF